jgi:ABC-type Fe3+-siderophore transport system permease subunit
MVLLLIALLLRKHNRAKFLATIGLGIFLVEWAVVLGDLGFKANHLYNNNIDFVIIASIIGMVYLIYQTLRSR